MAVVLSNMASSIKYDVSFLVFILVILDVCLCCAVCFSILYFCFEAPNCAMMAHFFNWLYGMREKEEPWRVYSGDFFHICGQSESLCFSVGMITMDSSDVPFIFILHDWEAENCICCLTVFLCIRIIRCGFCPYAWGNLLGDRISAHLIVFCLHT